VREEDGSVIVKLCGRLTILICLLEWVVLILMFFLTCYSYHEGGDGAMRSGKVQNEDLKDWPLSLQV